MKPRIPPADSIIRCETCGNLSRVRQWVEGFEAAGKSGPLHVDALRKAQVLLGKAKPIAENEV